ncbi:hypothetical protein QBC42DRAFT_180870 [Cladorrhinum samala]|uniref:Signal peptidase complex catalytic subunit SEC11 n=1 Tax=Cladorrhinum samala TaxID=585594 RepID=A0AAV9HI02_9PEZI|nr:hypothetical protein QBC42DRAFT_180870 [Cladorrhinum samala]
MASLRYGSVARSGLISLLPLLQIVSHLVMGWKALSLVADTPYPAMIVITESMVPAFNPGDILFIVNRQDKIRVGDLPVAVLPNRPFPMIHRVVQILYETQEGEDRELILTKGDNNEVDDTMLYPEGQRYIQRHEIVGFVRGYLPFLGWVVIFLQNPGRVVHALYTYINQ